MRERWFQWVGLAGMYAFVALVLVVYSLAGRHGARPSGGNPLQDWFDERTGTPAGGDDYDPIGTPLPGTDLKGFLDAGLAGMPAEVILPIDTVVGAIDPDTYFDEPADTAEYDPIGTLDRILAEMRIHEAAVAAQKEAIGMPGAEGLLMRALAGTVIRRYDRGATVRDRAVVYAETVDWLARRRLMLIGPPGVHHMMINRAISMLTDPATAPSEWWADAAPLPEERHPVWEWVAGLFR